MLLGRMRGWGASVLSGLRVQYYRCMGVTIGKRCYISSGAHIDVTDGRVVLGNRVRLSSGSFILGHAARAPRLEEGEATVLEDNVVVFVNSVVLPGVRVGRNTIVGAGSVISRDVPPNVVVMGNPARVIQHLSDKEVKRLERKLIKCCGAKET